MPTVYASFDIESTGTNPREDAIIEVGIVRFSADGTILRTYSTLVRPTVPLPPEIAEITGITEAMLRDAPRMDSLRTAIMEELSGAVLVGHNVEFDLSFMDAAGLPLAGRTAIDTFALAKFLAWDEASLNLGHLARSFGLETGELHRATDDALVTARLFCHFAGMIAKLDPVRANILRHLAERSPANTLFSHLVEEFADAETPRMNWVECLERIVADVRDHTRIETVNRPESVPELSVDELLRQMRAMAEGAGRTMEDRPEQRRMIDAIADALDAKRNTVIEAPTGIGKTFAYLLPSLARSLARGERMMVSTHTKLLQDQLLDRDIPFLRAVFAAAGVSENAWSVAKLKGRGNYCSVALAFERISEAPYDPEFFVFAAKTLFWMMRTRTGELEELVWYGREYEWSGDLRAKSAYVLERDNPYRDVEFLMTARERAKTADCVVVNHAFLLSEYAEERVGKRILPPADRLVIDEAHTLEDTVTGACRQDASYERIDETLGKIEAAIRTYNTKAKDRLEDPFVLPEWTTLRDGISIDAGIVFDFFSEYFAEHAGSTPGNEHRDILRKDDVFAREGYATVERAAKALEERMKTMLELLWQAPEPLARRLDAHTDLLESCISVIARHVRGSERDAIHIVGSSVRAGAAFLAVAPLRVGEFLRTKLWSTPSTKILASATLRVGGSFDAMSSMLGLEGFDQQVFESDFDYATQSLFYVPTDLGDVRQAASKNRVHDFLVELVRIVGGRTLALFTSFASIREAYVATNPALKSLGIRVLAQGLSGGKQRMLAEFLSRPESCVIYGTDSFWQGIDIPGDDLGTLIIHKLPFAVPTDPVVAARSSLYADAFAEYSVPQMILKLRQGIGRLIRTRTDRGIVVMLDSRVLSGWGTVVLDNLPPGMKVRSAPSAGFLGMLRNRLHDKTSEGG
jgi:predicted DnaQ family exonuclease/DinG family helicase